MVISIINLNSIMNTTNTMITTINIMRSTHLNSGMTFHLIPILNIAPMSLEILLTFQRSILFSILRSRKKVLNFLKSMIEDWITLKSLQAKFHLWKYMFPQTFQVFLLLLRFSCKKWTFASKPSFMATNDFFRKKRVI
jgi:hypothetical protein